MNKPGIFQIGNSEEFAVQVPDDSVGCSASCCSHCNAEMAYCDHSCPGCGLYTIGPFGVPQIGEWSKLSDAEKQKLVETVYLSPRRGTNKAVGILDLFREGRASGLME